MPSRLSLSGCVVAAALAAACGPSSYPCSADLEHDPDNCGKCGNACDRHSDCVQGECVAIDDTAGGSGGSGGAGGTGGTGGAEPCEDLACQAGEGCYAAGGAWACRCRQSPDSCPRGQFCGDDLRCRLVDSVVVEFGPCDVEDQLYEASDGAQFYCTNYAATEGLWWLRVCGAPEDCKNAQTFCLGSMLGYDQVPFCYFNLCGDASIGPMLDPPFARNGEPFGPCSSSLGHLSGDTPLDGTCVPFTYLDGTVGGICTRSGGVPKGQACRPDAEKDEPSSLCTIDAQCLAYPADEPTRGCASDAPCAAVPATIGGVSSLYAGYCSRSGTCQPLGFCADNCNAGNAGASVHPAAGCTDPSAGCVDLSGAPADRPVREGYCSSL